MKASVLVIGAGNMGGALAKGLAAAAASHSGKSAAPVQAAVRLYDVHKERMAEIAAATGAAVCGDLSLDALNDDVIVICVKPQDLLGVATDVRGRLKAGTTLISILAGVTLADLEDVFAFAGGIVRAMPNIAATIGMAATALCHNDKLLPERQQLAQAIFSTIGAADWTKESLLDAVTGLSGSGPAYVYMVIEALTDGGVKMGIPRALAAKLAVQTVIGASSLVQESGLHPAILRDQVTTPGGTTINAIHELEQRGLRAMLISAVETATLRSAALRLKPK